MKKGKKAPLPGIGPEQQAKIIPWSYAEKIEQTVNLKLALEILKNQTNEDITKTAAYMFLATVLGYLVEKAPLFEERKLPPLQMEFYSVIFVAACGGIYWYWRKAQIPDIIADGFDSLEVYDTNTLDNRIKALLSENDAQMSVENIISFTNSSAIAILSLLAFFYCMNGQTSSVICIVLPLLFLKFFLNKEGALRQVLYDENTINPRTVQNILTTQHGEIIGLLEEIQQNNTALNINIDESTADLNPARYQGIALRDKRICCTIKLYGKYRNLDIKYVNKELCYMLGLINVLSYPNVYTNRRRTGISIMTTSAFSKKAPLIDKSSFAKTLNQRLDFLCDVKRAKVSVDRLSQAMSKRFKGDWHWSYINTKEYNLALCFSVLPEKAADKAALEEFFNGASPNIVSGQEDEQEYHIICDDINSLIVLLGLNQTQEYRSPAQQNPVPAAHLDFHSSSIPSTTESVPPKKKRGPSNPSAPLSSKQVILAPPGELSSNLSSITSLQANPTRQDEKGIRVNAFKSPHQFFYFPASALKEMDNALKNTKASEKMRHILNAGTCLSPADRGTQGIKIYKIKEDGTPKFNLVLKPIAAFGSLRIHFKQEPVTKEEDGSIKYEMSFQKIKGKR